MKYIVFIAVFISISGCASYSTGFARVETLLEQQKPAEALAEHEKHPPSGTNKLLYLLDRAMLQRMSGLYEQSNATFEEAKKVIAELDGISISEQAGAMVINDEMMSYEGEDYEQVAVHLYEALNYIKLGLWDEARVEALQVDLRLKKIAEDQELEFEADAFSRYLSGIIYEQSGEPDEAMIAYRKAYQTYVAQKRGVPEYLKHDLLRLSQYLGLTDEYKKYQKNFGIAKTVSVKELRGQGEVILLLHHSLAPIKRSISSLVMGSNGVQHRVSLPEYQSRPSYVTKAVLTVGDASAESVLVNDFDMLARRSLDRHKPAMVARLIARVILKKAMAKNAKKNGGDFAGFFVDVAGMVSETADTRSWLTLPKNIHLVRLHVQEGTYPATLTLYNEGGALITSYALGDVTIKKGNKTMLEKSFVRPFIPVVQ